MKHRIVVLGAGYAGAIAAGRLAKRLHPRRHRDHRRQRRPDFVERVRMHQLATGQDLKRRPLSKVYAGTGVDARRARVTAVDVDRRTVALADDDGTDEIAYDTLVYALGSAPPTTASPGSPSTRTTSPAGPRRCGCATAWPTSRPAGPCSSSAAASPAWKRPPRSPRPGRTSTSRSPPAAASATGSTEGAAAPAGRLRPARHHRPRAHRHRAGRGDRCGHRRRSGDPGPGDRVDGRLRRPPHRRRHDPGGRGDRADRRRRHHAVGLAPRGVRGRRRRPSPKGRAASRCGCPAPRASRWPGRPPTPSPHA